MLPFFSLISDEDASARNIALRQSSMGGYLLKLKHEGVEEISAVIASQHGQLSQYSKPKFNIFGHWNRRWVNIEGHYLRWYTNVTSNQPSGSLDLRYISCIRELNGDDMAAQLAPSSRDHTEMNSLPRDAEPTSSPATNTTDVSEGAKYANHIDAQSCFLVQGAERSLVLRCKSIQERSKWINILLMLADKAKGGDGTHGVSSTLTRSARPADELLSTSHHKQRSAAILPSSDATKESTTSTVTAAQGIDQGMGNRAGGKKAHKRAKEPTAFAAANPIAGMEARLDAALSDLYVLEAQLPGKPSADATKPDLHVRTADDVIELAPGSPSPGSPQAGASPAQMSSPLESNVKQKSSQKGSIASRMLKEVSGMTPDGGLRRPSSVPLVLSSASAASTISEDSSRSSMGGRIRHIIYDNPLENDSVRTRQMPMRPSSSGGGVSGMLGLGGRKGVGYGTGSAAAEAAPGQQALADQMTQKVQVKSSELVKAKPTMPLPMPGTSAPAAYRLKKDDILKKTVGSADLLPGAGELATKRQAEYKGPQSVARARTAWGSPDTSSSRFERDDEVDDDRSAANRERGYLVVGASSVRESTAVQTTDSLVKTFSTLSTDEDFASAEGATLSTVETATTNSSANLHKGQVWRT